MTNQSVSSTCRGYTELRSGFSVISTFLFREQQLIIDSSYPILASVDVVHVFGNDVIMMSLLSHQEVRKDEVELEEDEALLPVAHFHKVNPLL